MRASVWPDLAHKNLSTQPENRVITRGLGYARGLCVPHANLSELAVLRINARRIPASRGEVIELRHPHQGHEKPHRLYGDSSQPAGGHV